MCVGAHVCVRARVTIHTHTRVRTHMCTHTHINKIKKYGKQLTLRHLRDLTLGVYQVRLAPGYIQDKMLRDNIQELEFDERIDVLGILRARVHSRFYGAKKNQTFIAYIDQL